MSFRTRSNAHQLARTTLDTGPRAGVPARHRAAPTRLELERLLAEHGGNVAAVARALDRQWNVVYRWVERYGLGAAKSRE
jgi:transcriptional regulator of acetoin/glycerol metabolism